MKKVWTLKYYPFIMGGDVWRPVFTLIKPIEIKTIKGIEFYSFKTQKGSIRIAEGITGGIIADSFKELETNIKNCSKTFLIKQIKDGQKKIPMEELSNKDFFKAYKY